MTQPLSERVWRVFSIILRVLLYAACGGMLFQIWDLGMLPAKYFLILFGVVLLLVVLISLLLIRPRKGKWQKRNGFGKQVVGAILALVLILGCAAGFHFAATLNETLSSITAPEIVHVLLDIYVRAEDPAQNTRDIAQYTFALADSTEEADNQAAVAELEALLGCKLSTVNYPTAFSAIDALYAGEVQALILDSSYLSILDSLDGYSDFESRVRLLHEHVIEKKVPQTDTSEKRDPIYTPPVQNPSSESFLLYISGNDARRQYLADGGSDVNILVAVNPRDHQILMVNTPRDYYVVNPASPDGSRDKLSHCGLKGIDNCVQAITSVYGHPIHYYARINFSGFRTLVDAIGGVTVQSEVSFSTWDYHFRKGENHLNGDQALAFARERKNLAGGDNDRGKNQMRLIEGMIRKLASGTLLTNYGEIMESLEGMFSTSMSTADIAKLVQFQLSEMPDWEIYSFAVTGDNGNDFCWAAGGNGYVMYPHEDVVAHASALIGKVLEGEKISSDDLVMN